MSNNVGYSRFFGGCGFDFGGMLLPILVIFVLFSFGEELFEFLFCEESALIWIILLVILFMFLGEDDGCCC